MSTSFKLKKQFSENNQIQKLHETMNYSEQRLEKTKQPMLMAEAKSALDGKWGLAIGTYVIFVLVSFGAGIVPFGSLLLGAPLTLGLASFNLKMARRENPELNDIFSGFKNFGNAVLAYLLMGIVVCLGFILLIVPGIMLAFGLSQTFKILVDEPNLGAVDAMKKSWAIMDGRKMDLFVLGLRFIPLCIVCLFTLGIGFLWLGPYMSVTYANFYDDLGHGNHVQSPKDEIMKHLIE